MQQKGLLDDSLIKSAPEVQIVVLVYADCEWAGEGKLSNLKLKRQIGKLRFIFESEVE